MKILKLGVKNFRSYGENDASDDGFHWISLENDIVFLIGQNDAGKSTLLHAYEKLFYSKGRLQSSDFHNFDINLPVEICAVIQATEAELEEEEKVASKFDADRCAVVRKVWSAPDTPPKVQSVDLDSGDWGTFGGFDSILQSRLPYPAFFTADKDDHWIHLK